MIPAGPIFHKPKSFISAKNLLYTSICIGFFTLLLHKLIPGILNSGTLAGLILIALGYLILFLLVKQLGLCKQWARSGIVVVCIFIAAAYLYTFKMELQVSMAEWAFFVLQALFELIAILFLFNKETSEWLNSSVTNTLA
jgi:hypothetical protein